MELDKADAPWRVAVVVPCHNDGATVEASVASIRAQEEPKQLVVVNDGSTDPVTLAVLERMKTAARW